MLSATEAGKPEAVSTPATVGQEGESSIKENAEIIVFSVIAFLFGIAIFLAVITVRRRRAEHFKDEEIASVSTQSAASPPWESSSHLVQIAVPESYMPGTTRNIDDIKAGNSISKFGAEHHQPEESESLMRSGSEDSSNS